MKFTFILFTLLVTQTFAQTISSLALSDSIQIDGMSVSESGLIYACQGWDGSKVLEINDKGEIKTFATGLKGPVDIIKAANGHYYISEWNNSSVAKIDLNGTIVSRIKVHSGPGPMALDSKGNIYISHNLNNQTGFITRINQADEASVFSSDKKLTNPGGVAFDSNDNLYVANFNNADIIKITPKGKSKIIARVTGDQPWRTGHLKIINDRIYVSSLMGKNIYKYSLDGEMLQVIGSFKNKGDVDNRIEASFTSPNALFYDKSQNNIITTNAFEKNNSISIIHLK